MIALRACIAATIAVLVQVQPFTANAQVFAMGRDGNNSTLLDVRLYPFSITPIGTTSAARLSGIDFSPVNGVLFACSAGSGPNPNNLFTLSTTTGAATMIGATTRCHDIAFDNAGALYGTNLSDLVSIDPATGAGTIVGSFVNSGDQIEALAVDPTTNTLHGLDFADGEYYAIDKGTGVATLLGLYDRTSIGEFTGMGIDDSGRVFASTGNGFGDIAWLKPNFDVVVRGEYGFSVSDIAIVPEPGVLPLSLASLVTIVALRRHAAVVEEDRTNR